MSHEDCAARYARYDSEAHLCAGKGLENGSGGCQGDSGGPLVCEKGRTWYLHGAVSFGKRGCPTTASTVFTRITTYIPWIYDKIGISIYIYLRRSRFLPKEVLLNFYFSVILPSTVYGLVL